MSSSGDGGDLFRLRDRIRILVALAFVGGVMLDRVGPTLSSDWQQYSDWSLGLVLAAILVLLGSESLAAIFSRFLGGGR